MCKRGLLPYSRFKKFRNMLKFAIKLSKKIYYKKKFQTIERCPKSTWKLINNLLKPKNKSENISIEKNGNVITDPSEVSTVLNEYFCSTPYQLHNNIPNICSNTDCKITSITTSFHLLIQLKLKIPCWNQKTQAFTIMMLLLGFWKLSLMTAQ